MAEQTALSISFGNLAHDDPPQVRYCRDGELLMAGISLQEGSKVQRRRYQRRQ